MMACNYLNAGAFFCALLVQASHPDLIYVHLYFPIQFTLQVSFFLKKLNNFFGRTEF